MTDGLKDKHREAVISILSAHPRVERAVLFGSRAMGTFTMNSDVDIALFGDELTIEDAAKLSEKTSALPMAQTVDLLLYRHITSQKLLEHIEQYGIVWFDRATFRQRPVSAEGMSNPLGKPITIGWQHQTWDNLVHLEYGKGLRTQDYDGGGFRVFGTNGQTGWHSQPLCEHPTVVIGRKGAYRGVHYSADPCYVIDTASYLVPKSEIDMRWAYYCLLNQNINGMDSGSAIPSTSRSDFYRLHVLVPPLPEQRAIAHILGTLDDKIELIRRMNETLEAMARALFKSWFVDFDPVRAKAESKDTGLPKDIADLFPSEFQDSELGEIPKGWKVGTVGELAEVIGGTTPSTKVASYWDPPQHCWATPKDLSGLQVPFLLDTERRISEKGLTQIGSGLLPAGSILLSSRAPIGYLAIAEVPVAINQGFIGMIPRKGIFNLFLLFWAEWAHEEIVSRANGSTFLEISKSNFRPMLIVSPDVFAMHEFEQILRPIYSRILVNERASQTLAALRDALLPRLLSGDVSSNLKCDVQ